ncbi:MAG: single-stranded DNA-binding protein, partial [Vicinamibacterales bacterium]
MNKAILIGNLGRDAELKYTPNGKAVATWSMATTESWKNQQGQR